MDRGGAKLPAEAPRRFHAAVLAFNFTESYLPSNLEAFKLPAEVTRRSYLPSSPFFALCLEFCFGEGSLPKGSGPPPRQNPKKGLNSNLNSYSLGQPRKRPKTPIIRFPHFPRFHSPHGRTWWNIVKRIIFFVGKNGSTENHGFVINGKLAAGGEFVFHCERFWRVLKVGAARFGEETCQSRHDGLDFCFLKAHLF